MKWLIIVIYFIISSIICLNSKKFPLSFSLWCRGTSYLEHHAEILFLQWKQLLQLHRRFTIAEAIPSNEYLWSQLCLSSAISPLCSKTSFLPLFIGKKMNLLILSQISNLASGLILDSWDFVVGIYNEAHSAYVMIFFP